LPAGLTAPHGPLASYKGKKVVAGLRPEHLGAAADDGAPVLQGDVDLVEALGSEALVHFSIDAKRITAQAAVEDVESELGAGGAGVARVDSRRTPRIGDRVNFAVDVERMQFFDAETGLAVTGP
jgi:multiple sugar transport system ATP-binding protein